MKGFFASSVVQSKRPDEGLIPKCGKCGLYKTCQSPKIPVYGDGAKRILVVGEAPGKTEDEQGRPFVGKAGQHLRDVLGSLGVRLDRDAWTTNAVICRPPNNEKPDSDKISYCRPNLIAAIRELEPRVIITLGHVALESVIKGSWWKEDVGTMERWAGWKIPLEKHWLCPTYHPSFLLRMKNVLLDKQFADHLETAFEINENPPRQQYTEDRVQVIYDPDEAAHAIDELDEVGGWASFDFETNCLKPEYPKAELVSCAISNGDITIAYPLKGAAFHATRRFVRSKRTRKISANMKMEDRWARFFFKTNVRNWGWDIVLAAHVLDNRQHICSLKFQSFIRLGVPIYNSKTEPYLESVKGSHYNRIKEIEPRMLYTYNGMDALLQHGVAMDQMEEMGYER
jgi:DNA polymerase